MPIVRLLFTSATPGSAQQRLLAPVISAALLGLFSLACRRFSRTHSVHSVRIAGEAPYLVHHAENDAVDPVIHGSVGNDTQNAPLSIVVLNMQLLRLYLLDDIEHILLQTAHVELEP